MPLPTLRILPRRLRVGRALARTVSRGLSLAAPLALLACGTADAPSPFAPTQPVGRVRFVNLITAATPFAVNATLEGVPFGVNLGYGASTPSSLPSPSTAIYSPVYAGPRTLVLRRTADTTQTVASLPFTAVGGQDQTLYALGSGPVTGYLTTDDNATAAASGQARVRVVHAAPSAGAVDLFVTAPGADLATATPTLATVGVRSASAYLAVPAGTYQIRAVPAGTAPAARAGAVALNVASITFPSGGARTVIAADAPTGGAPLRAIVLTDQ
jgi:hypothetical protein